MFGAVGLCIGFNLAALKLVFWTGMPDQNARTMDCDTATERAVAGQQSCMTCRLIDDRQDTGETEGKAIVFQVVEIKGVLHITATLVSRPQDKLQQVKYPNPPSGIRVCEANIPELRWLPNGTGLDPDPWLATCLVAVAKPELQPALRSGLFC